MYTVIISPKAQKELKIIKKLYKNAFSEAIKEIAEYPYVGKSLTQEMEGKFSYRVDVYRIIYKVNTKDKTILILSAGHRATIYY